MLESSVSLSVKMLVGLFGKLHMPFGAFVEELCTFSMSVSKNGIA